MSSPATPVQPITSAASAAVVPTPRISRQTWIILALMTVYLVWSTTYLGIRIALQSFPPFMLMGVRFSIAGAILFGVGRLRGAPLPTRRQWLNSAILGALLLVGGMGVVALAESAVSSGLAATSVAVAPLWIMLVGLRWGNRPRPVEWFGVLLGIVGVALLSREGNLQDNPAGIILLVLASLSWAIGSEWSKHMDLPKGIMGTGAEMLAGGALLLCVALARGEQMASVLLPGSVAALVYLIVFGSWATFTAYNYLLRTVRPALATSYALVNPAIALLLGVALGGEQLTGGAFVALPIILVGLVLVAFQRKPITEG